MVKRQSRILYRNRLYNYPLSLGNALRNMGPVDAFKCVLSYLGARLRIGHDHRAGETFDQWVISRFGRRLFEMFFQSYSEKLWGIPCSELDADFAAQRIRGFSLGQALLGMLGLAGRRERTLTDVFPHPRAGNGDVYERMARSIRAAGGRIHLQRPVDRVMTEAATVTGVALQDGEFLACDHVITTMPLTSMVRGLANVPKQASDAASRLTFRNTVIVYLLVERADLFSDQWLYVHSPELQVGRVTNFRNWVPELYGSLTSSVLALEYWCNDDEPLWRETDDSLVGRAIEELHRTGLASRDNITGGKVVRVPRCYPVYKRGYKSVLAPVVEFLKTIPNLWPVGRYGSFKYNNQDHSILMGLLAAENIAFGASHDLWSVNSDDEYHEETTITEHGLISNGKNHV
jgi:protoporphyrinogen oxidase